MSASVLVVEELTKAFGDLMVLRRVALTVKAGEVVALTGDNGSGKSTLLACVVGNLVPDAGHVHIDGHDLRADPLAARRRFRYVPQDADVLPGVTGRELVMAWAQIHGGADPAPALALADLGPSLDLLATTYSVGMRRRLQLAMIALGQPSVLVLDEPFAGLDTESSTRLVEHLHHAVDRGVGVLIAAHEAEVRALAHLPVRRHALKVVEVQ